MVTPGEQRELGGIAESIAAPESSMNAAFSGTQLYEAVCLHEELDLRRLLKAVAAISTILADASDVVAALPTALGMIGEAGHFSRCLVLRKTLAPASDKADRYTVAAEWCAPGVRPHQDCGSGTIASPDAEEFIRGLRHGEVFRRRIDEVDPPLRSVFARMEIRATGCAPITVEGQLWGTLALDDCARDDPWDEAHIDALTTMASAISNALQNRHRAERLAIEQVEAAQQRAAELARANAVLRRSISRLAEVSDVEAAMVEAIATAAESIGSSGGALGLYSPEERGFRTVFQVVDGKKVDLQDLSYASRLYSLDEEPIGLAWEQFHRGDGVLWCPLGSCYLTEDSRQLIQQQGFHSSVLAALRRGAECIGYLGFLSYGNEDPVAGQRETLRAIADQVSLMLELSRLANLSESAAVARQRELAAQEKAAELERINALLRTSSRDLARAQTQQQIFEAFLLRAVSAMHATAGGLLERLSGTSHEFCALVQGDHSVPRDQWPQELIISESADVTGRDEAGVIARVMAGEQVWIPVDDAFARWAPGAAEFHRRLGNQALVLEPFWFDGEVAGYLGIAFSQLPPPTQAQNETVRALSHQATLALELNAMHSRVAEAIVAREREIAAQERAAELELANQALRRGIAGLGQLDDLSDFLSEMLRAAVTAAGAQCGGVNLIDEQTQTFCVCPLLRSTGQIEPYDSVLCAPLPITPGIRSIFNDITSTPDTWMIPGNDPRMGQPYLEFHAAEGNDFIAHVPLYAGSRLLGLLGLGFKAHRPKFDKEFPLLRSLADQMSLAVEMVRLSDEAKSAAVARDREVAAQQRAAELERTNAALQETTDGLATASGMDQIVPIVFRIISRVFGVEACGYYEFHSDYLIWQRYWFTGGSVYTPQQMARYTRDPLWQELASGFTVPEGYVTGNAFSRTTPDVIDHYAGTCRPDFDKWAIALGGGMELNVPLVANGVAIASITLMRRHTRYTPEEVNLAVALTRQLTLAVQAERLAAESRMLAVENAVSREREQAAQERTASLALANEQLALRDRLLTASASALEQLISAADFSSGVVDALRQIGEAAKLSRVQVLMETALPNKTLAHELIHEWWSGDLESQKTLGYLVFPNADNQSVIDLLHKGERWWARTEDWPIEMRPTFRALGIVWTGVVPIFVQHRYVGFVAFDQCNAGRGWSEAEIDALTIAAKGIGAALSQQRMATQLENEREQAAQDKASDLVKANFALRSSVDDLVTQTTTNGILTSLLKQAIDISNAKAGAILRRITGSEFEYVTIFANGAIRDSQEILAAGTNAEMRLASRLDPTGHFRSLANGDPRWREVDSEALAAHLPRSTAFHKENGNRRIYDFPYKVAGQVVGYLGLAFADQEPPSETVQETIKALATQVGLALEFRKISEQVERAAITEERNKFARDLHDTLAQGYAAILMQLGAAEQIGHMPAALQPFLARIDDLARSNLAEARKTVSQLRSSETAATREAFILRISELARQLEAVNGQMIQLSVTGSQRALPTVIEDELYLIAQESLTNSMKHAQAGEVSLQLCFMDTGLRMKVKDNGIGFASHDRDKPDHFGLQTMQERAQRIQANLTIISEPGFGTEILALWSDAPLKKSPAGRK